MSTEGRRPVPQARASGLPAPQRVAASTRGMVSTAHWLATEAAVTIMEKGGNAIDAAVAAAFALGVCEPFASGLGGQSAMLIHLAATRRTFALDGSSRAPHRTPPAELPASERLRGLRATTVPSTPAALAYAVTRYGALDLGQVLQPAIEMAEKGVLVSDMLHRLSRRERKHLRANSAGAFFLKDGKAVYAPGETLRQPVLAWTLRRIAEHGIDDFYRGEIANRITACMQAGGGLIHADDLAQVPMPIERRPVSGKFCGKRVFTFPPPGAGRTLLEILNILENVRPSARDLDTPQGAALMAEVVRRANIDRRDRPFDPNYYPQVEDGRMLREDYAKLVARQVRARIRSQGDTTHLSVMDGDGNAVALTQSIERVFGSFSVAPDLGFLFNNYMSAFEHDDITHPYYLRPNASPWASVAPTIVMRGGRPHLALGSPGSERIASSVAQVLLRCETMPLPEAVAAPRLHCSIEGEVRLEASRMRDDIPPFLSRVGYQVRELEPFAFYLGCVQVVRRDASGMLGVADLRRDGSAGGPRH